MATRVSTTDPVNLHGGFFLHTDAHAIHSARQVCASDLFQKAMRIGYSHFFEEALYTSYFFSNVSSVTVSFSFNPARISFMSLGSDMTSIVSIQPSNSSEDISTTSGKSLCVIEIKDPGFPACSMRSNN